MRLYFDTFEQKMMLLLDSGADPNLQDNSGDSALHYAARTGKLEAIPILIEGGADVNLQNNQGQTPLDVAANDQIAEILREAGAVISTEELVALLEQDPPPFLLDVRTLDEYETSQIAGAMRVDPDADGPRDAPAAVGPAAGRLGFGRRSGGARCRHLRRIAERQRRFAQTGNVRGQHQLARLGRAGNRAQYEKDEAQRPDSTKHDLAGKTHRHVRDAERRAGQRARDCDRRR